MSEEEKPLTAYPSVELEAQDQTGSTGLDSKMKPAASWTQLEYWTNDGKPYLKEYEGRGLLQDKAVLITGGDSGIGRSVAILMAREGADVSILYLPGEEEDAKYTMEEIKKAGRKAHGIALDLKEVANCKKAVEEHMSVHGRLNVLVNNSKSAPALSLRVLLICLHTGSMQEICREHSEIDISVVEKTFQTNVIQMMAMTKYALPHMKRGSSIINSTSVAAYMGNPELVDYSATSKLVQTRVEFWVDTDLFVSQRELSRRLQGHWHNSRRLRESE